MKKKWLILLCAIVACLCSAFAFTACGSNQGGGENNNPPWTNPDDGNEGEQPSNPDDGNEGEQPSNPDDGNEGEQPSNPDDGNQGEEPSNPDDGNQGEEPSTPDEFTVIFDANNGTFESGILLEMTTTEDSLLAFPEEPTRNGYVFNGWLKGLSNAEEWDFNTDRVTENITLYATWLQEFTVTFDANGGFFDYYQSQYEVVAVEGEYLEEIEGPTRSGYNFIGWYKTSVLDELWNFDTETVQSATTLYAGWEVEIIERDVTFVLNYEGAQNVVQSTVDGLVVYIPVRNGYVFNGWWISDGQTESGEYILSQKWDTSEIVTQNDLVLYAEWVDEATVSSQLSAPSVSITDKVFSWNRVSGAVRYDIRVYHIGSVEEIKKDSTERTSWTFPGGYEAGYYTVKIRAIGDGINTVNSSYVSKSYGYKILGSVSKIDFDITTSILTWSPVRNASAYELYVNNQLVEELTYATYNMSEYEAGDYAIHVIATREGYQSSSASATIRKIRLKTPELKIYVEKETGLYTLSWGNVQFADTYKIQINGEEIVVTDGTTYQFNNSAAFWNEDNTVAITMTALDSNADYLMSHATEEVTIAKLFLLTLDKNVAQGELTASGDVYVPQNFTVSFDLNGATGTIDSQVVTETVGLTYPAIPTREGYVFRGWFADESCNEIYDFTQNVSEDIILYAGWHEIQTEGYGNKVIDIMSNYNSSSNAYSHSMSNTSSSNAQYVYFSALTTGTYTLYYKNSESSSSSATYFLVYNVTKGSMIQSNSTITYTSYSSLSMSLTAGDVVYIRNYRYNTSYSPTFYFYITGATMPEDGGLSESINLVKGENAVSVKEDTYVEYGTEVTLTAALNDDRYVFDGWYDGETKVSDQLTYTFEMPLENVQYTAKWIYYTLTTSQNIDEAGTTTAYRDEVIKVGNEITVTAIPNIGYTFVGWYNGETLVSSEETYTFSMPETDMVLTAKYLMKEEFSNFEFTSTTNNCTIFGLIDKTVTEIIVPQDVTNIEGGAFSGCSSLQSITLPFVGGSATATNASSSTLFGFIFGQNEYTGGTETVQYYKSGTYENYYIPTSLKSVAVTGGRILYGAFYNCRGLMSIVIPDNVTSIGDRAFYNCSKLIEVYNLSDLTITAGSSNNGYVGYYAKNVYTPTSGVSKLTATDEGYIVYADDSTQEYYLMGYVGTETQLILPESINGNKYGIGKYAFYYCSGLTSVKIGNGVTSIGSGAFGGCSGLTEITLPFVGGSIKTVSDTYQYPFGYIFGTSSYTGGTETKQYYYGSSTSSTTNTTYYIPTSLKKVTITGGNILYGAFYNCSGLTSVTIGENVTRIGNDAFAYCSGLTSIVIPDSVERIGNDAFAYCSGLTSIVIPDSVESIGYSAFAYCSGLTSVTIGNGVTSLPSGLFNGCSSLESITLPFVGDSIKTASDTYQYPFGYIFGTSSYTGGTATKQYYYGSSTSSTTNTTYYIPTSLKKVTITGGNILYGAFYNCSGLTSVTIGDSVESIGSAFLGCSSLSYNEYNNAYYLGDENNPYVVLVKAKDTLITSITIHENTKFIYSEAFYYCDGLTSIVIPDSVKSIGSSAFEECSGLTSIVIPDSVKSIGEDAFYECYALTSIVIPDSVERIGNDAFAYCSGLTSIVIPDSVKSIGEDAFAYCSGLTSIVIPDSVKSIGFCAFYGCSGLTSIVIPDSVTSIGSSAFAGCYKLIEVYNLSGLTITVGSSENGYVGYYAKKVYTSLSEESKLTTTDDGYIFYHDNGSYYLMGYVGTETQLTLPKSINGNNYSIYQYAFYYCSGLTSIVISDNVTSIGDRAFYNCSKLIEVYNLSGLTITAGSSDNGYVGYYAKNVYTPTSGASKLTTTDDGYIVYADDSTQEYYLMGYVGTETQLTLPESINGNNYGIDSSAFRGCSGLTSVTIGNSVTSIGSYAFEYCSGLTSVTIGNSVESIGESAFKYCDGLTSVTIGNSVESIGESAFKYCDGLTSVTIGNSVESIGDYAFYACSGLTSIVIPDSVTSIGYSAFGGCSRLQSITLPFVGRSAADTYGGYTLFGYIFGSNEYTGGTKTEQHYTSYSDAVTYYIPASLMIVTITGGNICYGAFYNCSGLTSVTIGNGVTSIGESAFYGCSGLTKVNYTGTIDDWVMIEFGNLTANPLYYARRLYLNDVEVTEVNLTTVTKISDCAFHGCSGLTSVTIGNGVTSIGNSAFSDCDGLTSVTIGNSVESIGGSAFVRCYKLIEVYNLSGLTITAGSSDNGYVGYYAKKVYTSLSEESKLTTTDDGYIFYHDNGSYYLMGYVGTQTQLTLPESVNGNNYSIYQYAFYGCSGLTSVTIGNGVTSIGSYAFDGCSGLTSVTIGNGVTSIGSYAFYGCSGLTSIEVAEGNTVYHSEGNCLIETASNTLILGWKNSVIPDSVTRIGAYAFYYCSGLTSIVIPDSVTSIGAYAFFACSGLTSIVIPDSVKSIGEDAFYNCTALTEIKFNATAMNDLWRGDNVFYYAGQSGEGLTVTIGANVTEIPAYLFYGATGIKSVVFEEGSVRTSIGNYAFYNCSGLTSIVIPDNVKSIGEYAFYNCTALTEIKFNATAMNDLSSYNYVFSDAGQSGEGITVTIGANVTEIPAYLFCPYSDSSYTPKITSVVFEEGSVCTSIGNSAFAYCSGLTGELVIPDSVTSIGSLAFYRCSGLTSVTFKNPNGWYVSTDSTATSGTNLKLTNTSTNATYLKSTYYNYYWKRK